MTINNHCRNENRGKITYLTYFTLTVNINCSHIKLYKLVTHEHCKKSPGFTLVLHYVLYHNLNENRKLCHSRCEKHHWIKFLRRYHSIWRYWAEYKYIIIKIIIIIILLIICLETVE